jgi:hypothetical protein
VVLWTPPAVGRVIITTEVASAWLRGGPIVQVLYGVSAAELVANPDFPPFLRSLHMVQIDDIDFYLDQLQRRIEAGEAGQEGSV